MKSRKIRVCLLIAAALVLLCVGACAEPKLKETTKGGKVVRREWIDENGSMTVGPEGYAYMTRSFSGTTVTEKFYNLAGRPVQITGGYFGQALTYGNRHRLEEVVYLDADGKKTECTDGYARLKIVYTSVGKVSAASYFDRYNDPVLVKSLGYASLKSEYRGSTLTKTTWMDENKKPVDTAQGYAVLIQTVNKSNRVTGIRFEHADGSAAVCPEGWASCKRELDNKNREVSVKYYDLSGNLISPGGEFAYEVKTWDGDREYTMKRYNTANQQIPIVSGVSEVRREFNKAGQMIRETWLDASGKPAEDAEGIAVHSYVYDEDGRIIREVWVNADGIAVLNAKGYAGYADTFDEAGFLAARTFLGTDGKAVNTKDGYSEFRIVYGADRTPVGKEYYDKSGALTERETLGQGSEAE